LSSVLVARFARRSEVAPIVRAALDVDIVYVSLAQPPPAGRNTLQLFVGDELVGAVAAELVGSGRDGAYPLRVSLLDPAHAAELTQLADRTSHAPMSTSSAPSSRASMPTGPRPRRSNREMGAVKAPSNAPDSFAAEDSTLTSRVAEEHTLASRAPLAAEPRVAMASITDEIVATTVFDPDGVLRAKAVNTGTASDDQTLPFSGSTGQPRDATRPKTAEFFSDDELQTLPGQSQRNPGAPDVSWNVRIAPTTKDPLCGRIVGGKYVLDSVIGTGAIGIVFKASHRDLGRTVAIKVLNPRYRDDPDLMGVFRTEARAASQLEHPNVARVYDYGQEPDGLVYIVMEYLSGYTLGSVLDARRKLTPSRAVDIMMQVCAALCAAHDRDIVHRDVKPDNIVLVPSQDDEGQPVEVVKVCDFGLAALSTTRTDEGVAAGTPEYMSPEQSTGSQVSPASDVYACGIVLYEMLAGHVPFTSDQAYRILMKHRSEAAAPLSSVAPGLPPALDTIVKRCMEKVPARRYQSARELRVELRKLGDL